ncbi:MAG TPA: cob(I)yrinic acid a,c-diamide adenosyltransferase [Candidatus Paceibacterota bacterium]|nr:cob(I)yrinic acid a,c-diamide adenosyltransferase [Candidatus Paceibacterota bacterium]
MIVVLTGNGKGKTTSTLGQMLRAVGQGKRAIMFQFIKGPWISGEHKFFESNKQYKGRFEIYRGGKGFVGILGDKLPFNVHKKAAQETLKKSAKAIRSGKWDIVALDEVNVAVSLKLLKSSDVLSVIKNEPQNMIVVLSGRGAPASFIKRADLATEMRELKHPFNKGEKARVGFEF